MAHAIQLSREVLTRLAAAMPGFLEGLGGSLQPGISLQLRETFKVFLLDLEAIRDPAQKPFAERATWARQWHLQLFQGERPVGYVLAAGDDAAPSTVEAVFLADLATAIDHAVQRIDAEEPGGEDPEVCLLFAPSHHLHMLWIRRAERQIVALATELERDELYSEEEILAHLRAIPPIAGLRLDAPDQ
jgi:hypothetical protein